MNELKLPGYITGIMGGLETAGFEAYLVGGAVRDLILRRCPGDYDIATNALPADVMRIFEKTVPSGEKYGTVTVLCGGGRAEVTTFRSEAGYGDCRRPGSVKFGVELKGDLSRRDFTVNAMAYSPRTGLTDPFGGRKDLARRMIRAVGEPDERFREDALRILRAFRFAAQLGFTIDGATLDAARKNMPLCARLSGERVRSELERLLLSPSPSLAFSLVSFGLFDALGLMLKVPGSPERIGETPASKSARWASLFYLSGCDAATLFERLRFDNDTGKKAALLLAELGREPPGTPVGIKRRLAEISPPLYREYLCCRAALEGEDVSRQLADLEEIVTKREPYKTGMLALSGADLVAAGYAPGPEIGRLLRGMLAYVIDNPQENEKEKLLEFIKKEEDH